MTSLPQNAVHDRDGRMLPNKLLKHIFFLAATARELPPPLTSIATSKPCLSPLRVTANLALVCQDAWTWMRPLLWCAVHLTKGDVDRSALIQKCINTAISNSRKLFPVLLIRSLWIGPRGTQNDLLECASSVPDQTNAVIEGLLKDGPLRNLAVGLDTITDGWCRFTMARPTQLLLLAHPQTVALPNVDLSGHVFERVTHLIVEVPWNALVLALPEWRPLLALPALTHLCIRFASGTQPAVALKAIVVLLSSRTLVRLIVCVDNGLGTPCNGQNGLWTMLNVLALSDPRLAVLARALPAWQEWEQVAFHGRSVWARADDPAEREPCTAPLYEEDDWTKLQGFCVDDIVASVGALLGSASLGRSYGGC